MLFIVLFTSGCKKEPRDFNCFELKAIYIFEPGQQACSSNIWQVIKSTDNAISSGALVFFTTNDSYDPSGVKIGDILRFKLTMKVEVIPGIEPFCSYQAIYLLQGDLCK